MSYRAEVIADNSGQWVGNDVFLATKDEAERYARNLFSRWTLVREWRVVESDKPVNYRCDEYGHAEPLS